MYNFVTILHGLIIINSIKSLINPVLSFLSTPKRELIKLKTTFNEMLDGLMGELSKSTSPYQNSEQLKHDLALPLNGLYKICVTASYVFLKTLLPAFFLTALALGLVINTPCRFCKINVRSTNLID